MQTLQVITSEWYGGVQMTQIKRYVIPEWSLTGEVGNQAEVIRFSDHEKEIDTLLNYARADERKQFETWKLEKQQQLRNLIKQTRTNKDGTANSRDHQWNNAIREVLEVFGK